MAWGGVRLCGMDSTNLTDMNNTYVIPVGAIALYVVNVLESPPAVEIVRGGRLRADIESAPTAVGEQQ